MHSSRIRKKEMTHERYSTRVTLRTAVKRKNTFGRKMRENAVISSKYDFRHQRLIVSPICALEDEVDSVVLKLEEYAFPVYQDLSDVASQLEKRKRQHRPNQLRL